MSRGATGRAWIEIDAGALAHNIALLRRRLGDSSRLLAVVKADAYGHGMDIIAPLCASEGVLDFGVATVDEGIRLRALLPDAALYVIAPTLPADALDLVAHRLTPLIGDLGVGEALSHVAQTLGGIAEAHLEVDTGIGRAGVQTADAPALLRALDALPHLCITGLATHFACADEDISDAEAQYARFVALLDTLGDRAQRLLVHADNSPAALVLPPDTRHGMVRTGLLLYGIEPAPGMFAASDAPLRPVLSLKARVLLCRALPGGATVSYGRTYTVPPGGGVYATLGIGYGDGYPRRLSPGGSVLLHGQCAPIRGRVCMDQIVVDVSHFPTVQVGDVATLIGTGGDETLTAGALAAQINTTPHEITTCLTARLPRVLTE
ncbi:MAG: alanine racemase [Armatimonadota bacterium]|nr:alanine racemase [Armatimonadota bacterium]